MRPCHLITFASTLLCSHALYVKEYSFPDDFLFGVATSSYQIEGAWNVSGKGENIWDRLTHEHPELIADRSNGDVATDSYYKFREDIQLIKKLGAQFYRFSLSWSRILPNGLTNKINPDGIRYYNDVIDYALKYDIIPMVTLFHWDTPQHLQDLGGFANDKMVDWFTDYARVAFDNFGDRVKLWLTFNEPKQTCLLGMGLGLMAPGYNSSGIGDYMCTHNLLKAHASAYHLYNATYKPIQNGKIGITIDTFWYEPASQSEADIAAAQRMLDFMFGWYADPIFYQQGDYPETMRRRVEERSMLEGFSNSRLPKFSKQEIDYIKGTYDYFGLNHYTTELVSDRNESPIGKPSFFRDVNSNSFYDPKWPRSAANWLRVVPWGFRKMLNYIKQRYGDVAIYVTENGYADKGQLNDKERISYYLQYINAMLDAIYEDKVNVKAYTAWSLLDNFEWRDGYTNRFGLYHVNFNDPKRPRTPKASVKFLKEVITSRKLCLV